MPPVDYGDLGADVVTVPAFLFHRRWEPQAQLLGNCRGVLRFHDSIIVQPVPCVKNYFKPKKTNKSRRTWAKIRLDKLIELRIGWWSNDNDR